MENRCANSEALARYERETAKAEEAYDQKCEEMFEELDEVVSMYEEIVKRYELRDEAKEFIEDAL